MPIKSLYCDTHADEKRARGLNWIFYKKYDVNPIVLTYNDANWPEGISLADKLSMTKPRKLNFKTSDYGRFRAAFVQIVPAKDADSVSTKLAAKVADKSLSDISSIALVQSFLLYATSRQKDFVN